MDLIPDPIFDKEPVDSIEVLTIRDAANFLKLSRSTVRRLQQDRRIPFQKIGGSIRFLLSDLVDYLQRSRVESIGK